MLEQNLNEIVYQQIKQMLLDYEIIAGQKLVVSDLADRLGVSRTPVNNVLYFLAKQGFLDFVPNQGYTVHQLTREELASLYEMREVLELAAIEKAIAQLTEEKLATLEQKERVFSRAVAEGMGRGRFLLDQEFHAYIIELSGNQCMADYYREIYQKIFLRHRISPLRGERTIHAHAEHHEIYEALRLRDVARARQAISAHIQAGKEYINSFMF
jgi:GntR family transcriptional regulator, vanillate catabolism transcriptional regulator